MPDTSPGSSAISGRLVSSPHGFPGDPVCAAAPRAEARLGLPPPDLGEIDLGDD